MTSDEQLADQFEILRAHGAIRGPRYMSFVAAGYNYRLSDVHAAIGVVQMGRLDAILAGRRELAAVYGELLESVDGASAPITPEGRTHTYQSYVVTLDDDLDRDIVIDAMRERGIETTLGTYGMHLQPYFQERFGIDDAALPNATRAHYSSLTIPLYAGLARVDLEKVVGALSESIEEQRRG